MNLNDQVKTILNQELAKARLRNPQYSMRAFALRIGVAQSVVSQLLGGKRPLTDKTAKRILSGLNRSSAEIDEILNEPEANEPKYVPLERDAFSLISEWYYPAILSLAQTEDFQGKPKWVAQRLGIGLEVAEMALESLIRLGLLSRNGKKITATGDAFSAISASPQLALRQANQENLILAEKALAGIPVDERDFTALTLCFDPDRMEEARSLIKAFRRKFDRVMESGRKREVYKLCIQLFPLSRNDLKSND